MSTRGPTSSLRPAPSALLITGPIGVGKTTGLGELCRQARGRGLEVRGFLQERVAARGGADDYDLVLVASGERRPFLRRGGDTPGFVPGAFESAAAELRRAARNRTALLVIDELGWLEAAGGGHLPALLEALRVGSIERLAASVRADCLPEIRAALAPVVASVHVIRLRRQSDTVEAILRDFL